MRQCSLISIARQQFSLLLTVYLLADSLATGLLSNSGRSVYNRVEMSAHHRIFVYGSLLSGLHNHVVLENLSARYLFASSTKDKFYLTGLKSNEYPYLSIVPLTKSQSASKIIGEVYEVTSSALAALDEFELHPDEYLRTEIDVVDPDGATLSAYSYLLRNVARIREAQLNFDEKFVTVADGDWRRHLFERVGSLNEIQDTRQHLK